MLLKRERIEGQIDPLQSALKPAVDRVGANVLTAEALRHAHIERGQVLWEASLKLVDEIAVRIHAARLAAVDVTGDILEDLLDAVVDVVESQAGLA